MTQQPDKFICRTRKVEIIPGVFIMDIKNIPFVLESDESSGQFVVECQQCSNLTLSMLSADIWETTIRKCRFCSFSDLGLIIG
jgi:hypothetical protein